MKLQRYILIALIFGGSFFSASQLNAYSNSPAAEFRVRIVKSSSDQKKKDEKAKQESTTTTSMLPSAAAATPVAANTNSQSKECSQTNQTTQCTQCTYKSWVGRSDTK